MDSNHRPQGYEPCGLPDCPTPPQWKRPDLNRFLQTKVCRATSCSHFHAVFPSCHRCPGRMQGMPTATPGASEGDITLSRESFHHPVFPGSRARFHSIRPVAGIERGRICTINNALISSRGRKCGRFPRRAYPFRQAGTGRVVLVPLAGFAPALPDRTHRCPHLDDKERILAPWRKLLRLRHVVDAQSGCKRTRPSSLAL